MIQQNKLKHKPVSSVFDIRTIDDDQEVEDFSEESDVEVEVKHKILFNKTFTLYKKLYQFQPSKQKNKKKVDFDTEFEFVSSVEEYNKDAWNDLTKYVKRKAKTKTDDKIKKARKQKIADDTEEEKPAEINGKDESSNIVLSDDELKYDSIKIKDRKGKKRKIEEVDVATDEFFEDVQPQDENVSFYQMNLSRPLLKAIGEMKFVHPTPIQGATIPLALLGEILNK